MKKLRNIYIVIVSIVAVFFYAQYWLAKRDFREGVDYIILYQELIKQSCVSFDLVETTASPFGWEVVDRGRRQARTDILDLRIVDTRGLIRQNQMTFFFDSSGCIIDIHAGFKF